MAITGVITVGDVKFGYAEARTGTRAIEIWLDGAQSVKNYYKFSPDPHDDKRYNKDQPNFYREAAERMRTSPD
jgi:hypothetical protein